MPHCHPERSEGSALPDGVTVQTPPPDQVRGRDDNSKHGGHAFPNPESRIPSLEVVAHVRPGASEEIALDVIHTRREQDRHARRIADELGDGADAQLARLGGDLRSEEHTSELQSLLRISYAVYRLKKKTHIQR